MIKMKKMFIPVLITVLAILLCSCSGGETVKYIKITPAEAKTRMDSNDSVIILDVRTESEYLESHIVGAVLLPNESILNERPEELPDLNVEILVYCRSGNRSQQASEKLIALGYTKVFDFGGIIDWPYNNVVSGN